MTSNEARKITQNIVSLDEEESVREQDELTERYYKVAHSFIKDSAEKGKYDTGLCYQYDEEHQYDRKHQEQYEWALQRVGFRLQQEGYTSRFYHNRAINTMVLSINWEESHDTKH